MNGSRKPISEARIYDDSDIRAPGPEAVAAGRMEPLFRCRNLHAYYGESYVVYGVSFEVAHNEIMALLGRNGAGKTSTLRATARAKAPRAAPRRDLAPRQGRARDVDA